MGFGGSGTGWTIIGNNNNNFGQATYSYAGGSGIENNRLPLTTNIQNQDTAAWYNTKVPTGSFTASFTDTWSGNKSYNGAAFILQNGERRSLQTPTGGRAADSNSQPPRPALPWCWRKSPA